MKKVNNLFSTAHLHTNLKKLTVLSGGISFITQGIKLALHVISIAVLARLLAPSDFGLFAMVTIFTGIALLFVEGGLSLATIQKDYLDHEQVSNLFWLNSALGLVLCIACTTISPLIAYIFEEPRILPVMIVTSLNFLVGGLSVQHDALLRRQMKFVEISVINILSTLVGTISSISAALLGLEYWSLVIGANLTFVARTIMRWSVVKWVPSGIRRNTGVRPLVKFGLNVTGANLLNYITSNGTSFMIGLIGGSHPLGFYNRANTLTSIPSSQLLPPIVAVLQPAFSRLTYDQVKFSRAIISLLGKLSIISVLITITLLLLSDLIVLMVLGPEWSEAIPIFIILSLHSIVYPLTEIIAMTLVASNQTKALITVKLQRLIITIFALILGSYWGVYGILVTVTITSVVVSLPIYLYCSSKYLPITFFEILKSTLPAKICGIVTVLIVVIGRNILSIHNPLQELIVFSIIILSVYLCLCLVVKPVKKELIELTYELRELR